MFLNFNKKKTKQLIKASRFADGMSKYRLDWLEENKQSVCGNIYESWFSGNTVFIVSGYKNEYKLFSRCKNSSPRFFDKKSLFIFFYTF